MTMTKEFVKKTFAVALSRLVSALTSGRVQWQLPRHNNHNGVATLNDCLACLAGGWVGNTLTLGCSVIFGSGTKVERNLN